MSILDKYRSNIKADYRFTNGSLIDNSGVIGIPTTITGNPEWTKGNHGNALKLYQSTGYLTLGDDSKQALRSCHATGNFTIASRVKFLSVDTTRWLGNAPLFADDGFSVYRTNSSGTLTVQRIRNGAVNQSPSIVNLIEDGNNSWHVVIFTGYGDGNDIKSLLDGNIETHSTGIVGVEDTDCTNNLTIGRNASATNARDHAQDRFIYLDVGLSEQDMSQLYEEMQNESGLLDASNRNFKMPFPVAASGANFSLGEGTTADRSKVDLTGTTGNFTTASNPVNNPSYMVKTPWGLGNLFNGAQHYVTPATEYYANSDFDNGLTLEHLFRTGDSVAGSNFLLAIQGRIDVSFKSSKLDFEIFNGSLADVSSDAILAPNTYYHSILTAIPNGTMKMYINSAIQSDTQAIGDFNIAVAVSSTYGADYNSADPANIGVIGIMNNMYPAEWTQDQITARYKQIAQVPSYINTFRDTPSSLIVSTDHVSDFNIDSGTFFISDDGTDKWLDCVFSGVVYIKQDIAYGTWQFDLYKSATGTSQPFILFNSYEIGSFGASGQNGYELTVTANEQVVMRRIDNGVETNRAVSPQGYIAIATKYSYRITRQSGSIFTAYIKGGAFTDWTLIDSSIIGSNPFTDANYTASTYLNIDLDTGDKISNIKVYPLPLDPTNFEDI